MKTTYRIILVGLILFHCYWIIRTSLSIKNTLTLYNYFSNEDVNILLSNNLSHLFCFVMWFIISVNLFLLSFLNNKKVNTLIYKPKTQLISSICILILSFLVFFIFNKNMGLITIISSACIAFLLIILIINTITLIKRITFKKLISTK